MLVNAVNNYVDKFSTGTPVKLFSTSSEARALPMEFVALKICRNPFVDAMLKLLGVCG